MEKQQKQPSQPKQKKDFSKVKRVPKFKRQNWDAIKRVRQTGWRKPRGIDNKLRISKGGSGALPKIGYGTKQSDRDLHPSGLKEVIIASVAELNGLKNVVLKVARTVGNKKKIAIMAEAKKLGLRVVNPKTFVLQKKDKNAKKTEAKADAKKVEVKKTEANKTDAKPVEKTEVKTVEASVVEKTEAKPVEHKHAASAVVENVEKKVE